MGSKGPLPLGGSRAEPWPSFLHLIALRHMLIPAPHANEILMHRLHQLPPSPCGGLGKRPRITHIIPARRKIIGGPGEVVDALLRVCGRGTALTTKEGDMAIGGRRLVLGGLATMSAGAVGWKLGFGQSSPVAEPVPTVPSAAAVAVDAIGWPCRAAGACAGCSRRRANRSGVGFRPAALAAQRHSPARGRWPPCHHHRDRRPWRAA